MDVTIDELTMPESPDDPTYLAYVGVGNDVEAGALGTDLLTPSPAELLPEYRDNPNRKRLHLLASVDDVPAGRAMVTTRPHTPGVGAYVMVDVLPEHRGQGIGAALLERVEALAAAEGDRTLKVSVAHTVSTPGDRMAAPTGFGDLPAEDPGVRFLVRHGFTLEQVARISVLDTSRLRDDPDSLVAEAERAAGADYRVLSWAGPTPDGWLDDLAMLRTRMSTDTPMAGLAAPPDPWDVERVVEHDTRVAGHAEAVLTTAVEHVSSGRLVGFSEIIVPPARPAAVQEDTLVLREHRGHRLGLLMKAVNARELLAVAPRIEAIVTWNAEENRPMLDVNERMGFRAIGYEGGWLRQG